MARTDSESVRAINSRITATAVLTPHINAASSLVDYISSEDSLSLLGPSDLAIIETWLAAYFYEADQQLLAVEKTGRTGATFQGKWGMHLDQNLYGQRAMLLDVTGTLAKLNEQAKKGRKSVGFQWLGTEVTDSGNTLS